MVLCHIKAVEVQKDSLKWLIFGNVVCQQWCMYHDGDCHSFGSVSCKFLNYQPTLHS